MDIRSQVIDEVLQVLGGIAQDVLRRVEDAITICLNRYELQERCTELTETTGGRDYLSMYLATLRMEGKAESTLDQYGRHIRMLLMFLGKSEGEITLYDLRYYLACYKRVRKVANNTLDNVRRYIRAYFKWLAVEGHIQRDPAAALKMIHAPKKVKRDLSAVELERIRNACKTRRDIALVEFLYATGARVSEVVALNMTDVDFERLEVRVLGKGNKERIVYMTERCAMYLREYLRSRSDAGESLFASMRAAKRLQKAGIERVIRNLGRRAGVSNVHPHRYRRTMATHLINRGCNIQDVQQLLGHESISTTQIYYVYSRSTVKAAYQKYAA